MNNTDRALLLGAALGAASRPTEVRETRTIIEQRAPTDESVRLLAEMQAAAEARIIDSLRLEGNGFSGVLHTHVSDADQNVHLKLVFDLNGKRMKETFYAPVGMGREEQMETLAAFRDKVAERIATEVLSRAFEAIDPSSMAVFRR